MPAATRGNDPSDERGALPDPRSQPRCGLGGGSAHGVHASASSHPWPATSTWRSLPLRSTRCLVGAASCACARRWHWPILARNRRGRPCSGCSSPSVASPCSRSTKSPVHTAPSHAPTSGLWALTPCRSTTERCIYPEPSRNGALPRLRRLDGEGWTRHGYTRRRAASGGEHHVRCRPCPWPRAPARTCQSVARPDQAVLVHSSRSRAAGPAARPQVIGMSQLAASEAKRGPRRPICRLLPMSGEDSDMDRPQPEDADGFRAAWEAPSSVGSRPSTAPGDCPTNS